MCSAHIPIIDSYIRVIAKEYSTLSDSFRAVQFLAQIPIVINSAGYNPAFRTVSDHRKKSQVRATDGTGETMPDNSRSAFLLVRNQEVLERSNDALKSYLSNLNDVSPGDESEALQGIWVDEQGVVNLPRALDLPDSTGQRHTVPIMETMGVNGVWTLCWLETSASNISRADLVQALVDSFGYEASAELTARFIPVINTDAPDSSTNQELHTLESRFPGITMPAVCQDGSSKTIQ